jgi:hypothetical protein
MDRAGTSTAAEARTHNRVPINGPVALLTDISEKGFTTLWVRTQNVSPAGLMVKSWRRLPAGSIIYIRAPQLPFLAGWPESGIVDGQDGRTESAWNFASPCSPACATGKNTELASLERRHPDPHRTRHTFPRQRGCEPLPQSLGPIGTAAVLLVTRWAWAEDGADSRMVAQHQTRLHLSEIWFRTGFTPTR